MTDVGRDAGNDANSPFVKFFTRSYPFQYQRFSAFYDPRPPRQLSESAKKTASVSQRHKYEGWGRAVTLASCLDPADPSRRRHNTTDTGCGPPAIARGGYASEV